MTETYTTPLKPAHPVKKVLKWVFIILGILLAGVLAIILVLGFFPISTGNMDSEPNPSQSYEDSMARFEEVQQAEVGIVNETSGSVLLTHGEKTPQVVVLIHGITNSPHMWLEFGEMLYEQGNNVLILRMPYHGLLSHKVSELSPLKVQDLRVYADQVVDIANGLGDEVVVIGISGGGTLASWMAQNRSEIDQAILLVPFYGVGGVPSFLTPILKNAFTHLPNFDLTGPGEILRNWAYQGQSTRGVAAFLALTQEVLSQTKSGKVPTIPMVVLTSAIDHTANNQSTAEFVDLLKKAGGNVDTFEFDKSLEVPHNSVGPVVDPAKRQIVYDKILEFLGGQP